MPEVFTGGVVLPEGYVEYRPRVKLPPPPAQDMPPGHQAYLDELVRRHSLAGQAFNHVRYYPISAEPYNIDPADLALIPWHNGPGAWGAQVPVQIASPPNTTRTVTVNTPAEFNTEASVAGTEITIGTDFSESVVVSVSAADIDVIVPSGRVAGRFYLQVGAERVRIRGTTVGAHSGGRIAQVYDAGGGINDVLIDGIDLNGAPANVGDFEAESNFRPGGSRWGIYRCRAVSPAYCMLGGGSHLIIKDTNMYAGAMRRTETTQETRWNTRYSGGPVTIIDSDLRNTFYATLRLHTITGRTGELCAVLRSRIASLTEEMRVLWIWIDSDSSGDGPGEGFYMSDSHLYGNDETGSCGFSEVRINNSPGLDCSYSRIRNCVFSNGANTNMTQAILDSTTAAANNGDHVWTEGNIFQSVSVLPPWDRNSVGNPEVIPLPGGATLSRGGQTGTTCDNTMSY